MVEDKVSIVFDRAQQGGPTRAAPAGTAIAAECANGAGLSRTAAVSPRGAGFSVAAVATVGTITKLLLELDIDVREHRRGPGFDDNRLRGVELHRVERSGPAAEAGDGDVRSRWDDEWRCERYIGRIDRLAGRGDIDRGLQGRFGVGAQFHGAAGPHRGIG